MDEDAEPNLGIVDEDFGAADDALDDDDAVTDRFVDAEESGVHRSLCIVDFSCCCCC